MYYTFKIEQEPKNNRWYAYIRNPQSGQPIYTGSSMNREVAEQEAIDFANEMKIDLVSVPPSVF